MPRERFLFCRGDPNQNIGTSIHAVADEHWLTDGPQCLRKARVTGAESPSGPLAVNLRSRCSRSQCVFRVWGIVRDVEQELQIADWKEMRENAERSGQSFRDWLARSPSPHECAEIAQADLELIGAQASSLSTSTTPEAFPPATFLEKIGADLMTKPARTAMNGHDHIVKRQSEDLRDPVIKDIDDPLNLQIVIT